MKLGMCSLTLEANPPVNFLISY